MPMAESKNDSGANDFGSKGQQQPSRNDMDSKSHHDAAGAKGGPMMEMEAKIPMEMDQVAPERGKSRGGTRGGKPNQATSDVGLSGGMANGGASNVNLDAEIERCDGSEAMTQELLGSLISRPKLTEKLLSKPPYRFLHDVIMEVIRATGFGSGLYDEMESDSANVSDKVMKMAFLEKMIKVVGAQLNTLVEAKPAKIVAGRDPQDTNNWLQLLAVAARHRPDSQRAVQTVLEQLGDPRAASMGGGGAAPPPSNGHARDQPPPSSASAADEPITSSRVREDDRMQSSRQAPSEPKEPISSREVMDHVGFFSLLHATFICIPARSLIVTNECCTVRCSPRRMRVEGTMRSDRPDRPLPAGALRK